jgi:DNA-binding transcriptional LysR family regulator
VDLELANVRAFVGAVDNATMTAAASALFITQQALSKRIAKLEATTGPLLRRTVHGVTLTDRGERFLPYARRLLATADEAIAATAAATPPALRVDVWGHPHPPRVLVQRFARSHDVAVQLSMRRNLPHALQALQRDELDVAFGNIANLTRPLPADLHADLACFTEGMALVHRDGPLGGLTELGPEHLSTVSLWMPLAGSSPEVAGYMHEYGRSVGMPVLDAAANIGVESFVAGVVADPRLASLVDSAWPLPADVPLLRLPIRPVPLYPWFAVRRRRGHPLATRLVSSVRQNASQRRLLGEHWLPATARTLGRLVTPSGTGAVEPA